MNSKIDDINAEIIGKKKEFSKRLNVQLLKSHFTSGAELGRAADITRDRISKYLVGASIPRPDKIKKLAIALGCEVTDLMPDDPRDKTPSIAPGFTLNTLVEMPGVTHLVVNMTIPTDTALKIATILSELQNHKT